MKIKKNRKSVFLGLLAFGFCVQLNAQQVEYALAKNIATNFLAGKKENSSLVVSSEHTTYNAQGEALLYIFNFEGGGFVIVAADKNEIPVLAYSPVNSFLMGEENPAAKNLVDAYAQKISHAKEMKAEPAQELKNVWEKAESGDFSVKMQKSNTTIGPLLTSTWNQSKYYNTLCPDEVAASASNDDHVPNGCVALAMAQIMYYHRYPRVGKGTKSYDHVKYKTQSANFAEANYNYEAMSDVAMGYSNAIALLCYHAGVSVNMNYGHDGSSSSTEFVSGALYNNFNYKNTSQRIPRGSISDTQWKKYLMTDLDNELPLYYSACGGIPPLDGCHAFVCDGYDITAADTFFHFNWGWGGSSNGWFTINTMLGYTETNVIIRGIEPANPTLKSTGADTLTATYGSFSDGSSPRVNYANNSNRTWLISPQNAVSITLRTSYFATEDNNDKVSIYSGNAANPGNLVAELSGNLDTSLVISASEAFVRFTSNGSVTGKGFLFTYTSNRTYNNLCPASTPTPNGYLTTDSSIINSSDGAIYDDENTCYWALKPTGAQGKIGIYFTKFDIEEGDFVELYTWNGTLALTNVKYQTHGEKRFTKENPPILNEEYVVPDNGVFIRFRTDNNLHGTGFELKWTIYNVSVNEAQIGIEAMSVYPNPATDKVKVQIETLQPETVQMALYDVLGRKVFEHSDSEVTQQISHDIDVSSFAKGIYTLRVTTSKGQVVRKIVIQ
ncbi:MAG: C10 family peptidase [Lentimicrobiaceae bacterium]|nr:C10 family peptidase [Lentimicrobiaceae bacterium]